MIEGLNIRKHFVTVQIFTCARSTGTGGPKRCWNLPPWRYSKTIQAWSWTRGPRWSCLSRDIGPDILSNLSHAVLLWFNLDLGIFVDLTLKINGKEIHSETVRYGDMQFLSDEINTFA